MIRYLSVLLLFVFWILKVSQKLWILQEVDLVDAPNASQTIHVNLHLMAPSLTLPKVMLITLRHRWPYRKHQSFVNPSCANVWETSDFLSAYVAMSPGRRAWEQPCLSRQPLAEHALHIIWLLHPKYFTNGYI